MVKDLTGFFLSGHFVLKHRGALFSAMFYFCLFNIHFIPNIHAQADQVFHLKITQQSTFETYARQIKENYGINIAFNEQTGLIISDDNYELKAVNSDDLVMKLSVVFGFTVKKSGSEGYLVRNELSNQSSDEVPVIIRIVNTESGAPVEDVIIQAGISGEYFFSDKFGETIVTVNENETITLSKLDYEESKFVFTPGKKTVTIGMAPSPVSAGNINLSNSKLKVKFNRSGAIYSGISGMDVMNISSVFGRDVLRSAQMYSGVNALNDASSNLRIRGAPTEATLLVLDGMPVYKADHFYGILSSVNGYFIEEYQLFKNNIPVYYGGKTAGLMEISSGNLPEKSKVIADVNYLYSSITGDIRINPDWGVKFGGRFTYTDLASSSFQNLAVRERIPGDTSPTPMNNLITTRPDFDFYDLNLKIYFEKNGHSLSLSGFKSRDTFIDSRRLNFRTILFPNNDEVFRQSNVWQNNATAFMHKFENSKHILKSRIWFSHYSNSNNVDALLRQVVNSEARVDTLYIYNNNDVQDLGYSFSWTDKDYELKAGIEGVFHTNEVFLENENRPILEINNTGSQWSAFIERTFSGSNKSLNFIPAARLSYLPDLSKMYFLPQFSLFYRNDNAWGLKAAAGRHMQYIRLLEHENNLGERQTFFALSNGQSLPVGLSKNVMVGADYLTSRWRLDVEFYYRKMTGVITHASVFPGLRRPALPPALSDYKIFQGDAFTLGTDLSLIYDYGPLFSMFSYTLSKTQNRFNEIFDNQYFPSSDDSRHQFKFVNTLKFGNWDFSINFITATGRPYIDLSSLNNQVDRSKINISKFIRNLPAYHRLDAGLSYRLKFRYFTGKLGFSIFNITNHENVRYRQFVFRLPGINNMPNNTILGSDVVQLERTVNFGLTLFFGK